MTEAVAEALEHPAQLAAYVRERHRLTGDARRELQAPGLRIAGGTDETLRNIISERVLGFPKEPGIDTTSPFRDIPHN